MARTLIMTVDRDNDLGVKAGIRGPVIGRKNSWVVFRKSSRRNAYECYNKE